MSGPVNYIMYLDTHNALVFLVLKCVWSYFYGSDGIIKFVEGLNQVILQTRLNAFCAASALIIELNRRFILPITVYSCKLPTRTDFIQSPVSDCFILLTLLNTIHTIMCLISVVVHCLITLFTETNCLIYDPSYIGMDLFI